MKCKDKKLPICDFSKLLTRLAFVPHFSEELLLKSFAIFTSRFIIDDLNYSGIDHLANWRGDRHFYKVLSGE